MTGNKEHQPLTRGIKHWGLSGYSSILPRIKFGVTGQESSPQSPTISYRQPLVVIIRNRTHTKQSKFKKRQLQTYASLFMNDRLKVWSGTLKT